MQVVTRPFPCMILKAMELVGSGLRDYARLASNRIMNRCTPFAIQLVRSGVWMAVLNLSNKMPAEGESNNVEMESENREEGVVSSKAKYRELKKKRLKYLVYVLRCSLG